MSYRQGLEHGLFSDIDLRQYALLRIVTGLLILLYLGQLLPYSVLHYSSDGWLGRLPASGEESFLPMWSVLNVGFSAGTIAFFWWFSMLFAVGFSVGCHTRICGWLTWLALVSIWHRNSLLLDGDDAILRMMLLYLNCSRCGRVWSIDAIGKRWESVGPIWPLRLMQVQMALIYCVSGWVKFHSRQWLDGSILQWILAHPQYSRWDLIPWFEAHELLFVLALLSHFIRYWELLFPLLLCHWRSRALCLCIGALFHIGLLAFMHLRLFAVVMLVFYIVFLPNAWFHPGKDSNRGCKNTDAM